MKGALMLVVSLRGVNFGFWSHLGCSGQNAIIFSREVPKMHLANMMNSRFMTISLYKLLVDKSIRR